MQREPGFYWVKGAGAVRWEPAIWNGTYWVLYGSTIHFQDRHLSVVGDRITPPEEK